MARKKVETDTPVEATDGGRQQMTDDGPAGIPVEEMSQIERKAVGKKLAEGGAFAEAVKEGKPTDGESV